VGFERDLPSREFDYDFNKFRHRINEAVNVNFHLRSALNKLRRDSAVYLRF